jgi:hypothetical protein
MIALLKRLTCRHPNWRIFYCLDAGSFRLDPKRVDVLAVRYCLRCGAMRADSRSSSTPRNEEPAAGDSWITVPPGVTGFAAGDAIGKLERYEAALRNVEALGHGSGPGFGFSCAEIAAEALGLPLRRKE